MSRAKQPEQRRKVMTKNDDIQKELSEIKNEILIEKGIRHGIKIRCAFVWSGMTGLFGLAGAWASDNIDALKAGFRAFWTVWGQKW